MATTEYVFEGKVKWCKVYPGQVNKWGRLTLNFYPKDTKTRTAIRDLGLRNGLNEDEDGFFYTFSKKLDDKMHPHPIIVVDADGKPATVLPNGVVIPPGSILEKEGLGNAPLPGDPEPAK